ncbi:biotin--[acetyl-CoA-carboxylase] ligase [Oceanospirillum maris]|uniref:biotin--[acetyl-CoA-carboxylase] ligase n=1 Tax=Oceanospirillum maris TaxID=64977 RepID=UPI0004268FA3|nr:biotin--[acetyl-CoA-carboxylase] ligase [Oceanospirillum maris]
MDNTALINMFSDGEWHSGVDAAALLGVSRAAVWKRLQKLEGMGLQIQREQSKGYRLPYSFKPLTDDGLEDLPFDISIRSITESTNTDAQLRVKDKALPWPESFSVVLAEQQTAGRGRRGKQWISPYGANLYLSCAASLPVGASSLETLSLHVGIILAAALQDAGLPDVKVKWPNDVYVQGKKIAGILIEVDGDLSSHCNVVIGIGVNFTHGSLSEDQVQQPYSAVDLFCETRREYIAAGVILQIQQRLDRIVNGLIEAEIAEWPEYDFLRNKKVTLHLGAQQIEGIARGIDGSGNLKIELSDGSERLFSGGEVSVRAQ